MGEEFGVCGDVLWCLRACMCVCVSLPAGVGVLFVTGPTVSSASLWMCTGSFATHWCAHGSRVRVCACQQLECVCVSLCCGVVASLRQVVCSPCRGLQDAVLAGLAVHS